ncbi:hypothetical protein KY290_025166 [Solanum tuberosum]|uniref:Uncharacterized protein n=1 Tax=Solanum tuberosum TaxID=4113 RepID=A0ABQ7UUT7_SOLTU|nr:hypothetical protein KY284_023970 [Solanum tuberosum]KAH0754896.1 hypothetical protein KY290_025166 [Solanum tuberosum]
MQINVSLPPSIDQVMNHSQTIEKGSSNPTKARSTRNAANRATLKMIHHIGSKPIRENIYQKVKDLKGGTSSKAESSSALCSTREDIKSLNEENKSLNDHLSTLEVEMKELMKMKEFFATQQ